MSSKTSKRRQKRLNTNEDEDSTEKVEKKSPKKTAEDKDIVTIEEDKEEEVEPPKEEEETNGCKGFENGDKETADSDKVEEEEKKKTEEVKETPEVENGVEEVQNSQPDSQKTESEEEIESLVIVESETETELQFHDSASETQSENDKSPVITSRCMTRRSHTKNAQNGVDSKITNDVRVTITRLENETKEVKETDEVIEVETTEIEENVDESKLDSTNASIFVNLGNDTTKNFDITVQSVLEDTVSNSFMENTKDMSYGETLRNLTGRRNLRSHDSPFRTRYTKNNLDTTDSRKSYVPHISSVKRKHQSDAPDEPKRFKVDTESPGLMSYISSPINSFRNKVSRSDIPSSTPKLMSYKYGNPGSNIIDEMSQIDLEEKTESKKWCSIM